MNWDQVSGSWKEFRGKVKEEWGRLTDDDLDVIDGRQEQLVGLLQKHYGMAREDAAYAVLEWLDRAQRPPRPDSAQRGPGRIDHEQSRR
jgi:uncharacterized protein YjbJ (UPF0337 family)